MDNTISLTRPLQQTYDKIFSHPVSHSVEWREVQALLEHLGTCTREPNGNTKVSLRGQTQVFPPRRSNEVVAIDDLMKLRHFLQEPKPIPDDNRPAPAHFLVVIDHRDARVFRSDLQGSIPDRIVPHPSAEHFRHAHHSSDFSRGQEKPYPNSFFSPVAAALADAGAFLVMGSGKGSGSEMQQFIGWLERHHPLLRTRMMGSVVVDQHHMTESQLLAATREFYRNSHGVKKPNPA